MIIFIKIVGGLVMLFFGGEVLVRGAISLAKHLGLSAFVIGLTVVAYGTSSPELFISLEATLSQHPGIALGNVIGSNVSNILCVLGLTAFIRPIAMNKQTSYFDTSVMLSSSVLLYLMCLFGTLSYITGTLFLMILVSYTVFVFKKASTTKLTKHHEESEPHKPLSMFQAILACVIGLIVLMLGANILIEGSVDLARTIGLSESVIGLTIIAFGGSVPELATSVVAALNKRSDIAFGNIIGSNLFNILGIIGLSSIVADIRVDPKFLTFDLPIMCFLTLLLFLIMSRLLFLSRTLGAIFFILYLAYISQQFL